MTCQQNGPMGPLLKWLLGISQVVVLAVGVRLIDHELRIHRFEETKEQVLHATSHAHSAETMANSLVLDVQQLRDEIETTRAQITTATDVLSRQIAAGTRDRFTNKEWRSEKEAIETQFENLQLKLDMIAGMIEELKNGRLGD